MQTDFKPKKSPGLHSMVDEVYTQNMWFGHYAVLFWLCMVQASKEEHSASYVVSSCSWLLAAVFISAANTPHLGAFEAGGHTHSQ